MNAVESSIQFPKQEQAILKLWQEKGILKKGLEANKGSKPFVFYDGPPFATGMPHYGHIIAGTLKDIIPRYWVMKGRYVQRRWGWDCHGLPVEYEMEKELKLSGRQDIEKFGIAKFNEACRDIVLRYSKEWEAIVYRTGRWVDFKDMYRTMDTPYMESIWWVFKQLWDKGLIFEGFRVMPYSWRVSTPLSNFEANLNYKSVQDPSITVKLKSKDDNSYYLIWTTTPWTLPSNLAISVHPDIDYLKIKDPDSGEHYILAEARLAHYYKDTKSIEVLKRFKGSDLKGKHYEPIFPYFKGHKDAFQILEGDHVTTEDGTGLVHTAPAFGEDDYAVCKKVGIELVNPVDRDGNFTSEVPDYIGQNVKEADKQIIKDLKAQKKLIRHETIEHNYPFCWRTDTPLIYRAISTWFVKLDGLKKQLVESNQKTHWVPEHLRDGRFGTWLENARDWNISRNRFWGTPLPIWRCSACDTMECMGSIEELEKKSKTTAKDLHKHFVDDIKYPCSKCDGTMERVPEVLDCWFESGTMPYGQAHYPFENRENFEASFPADFIAEGLDQTRGWFYTLSVLGNALFGKAPFKNVVVNGLILAEDGKKMSKSLKNYPDPLEVLEAHGADALRIYLMDSPASRAEELRFSEAGVKEKVRAVLLPLWNAYSFFVTYALADSWDPKRFDPKTLDNLDNELDKWILSRLQSLINTVQEKFEIYHLYEVTPKVIGFIDELTNWYIRFNRRRFWKSEKGGDKEKAYATLYYVLTEFTKVLAPILPFTTEAIYQNIGQERAQKESIHLCSFPEANAKWIHQEIESELSLVQEVIVMGRNLRNQHKIKTRQPLKSLLIITGNPGDKKTIEKYESLLSQELNVKEISFSSDEAQWVTYQAKPNAKLLGPRLGKQMKAVSQAIRELSSKEINQLESEGELILAGERVTREEVLIIRNPKKAGIIQTSPTGVTVWLDSQLDESLILEGRARDFINRVQRLRKELDLQVTDRICLEYACEDELEKAILAHQGYILNETLTSKLLKNADRSDWQSNAKLDEFSLCLWAEKAP